jgi:hypothetical protein
MSRVQPSPETTTVTILKEMNEHDAMCVEIVDENATRHIVDYDTNEVRQTLSALPEGASLPLQLERLEDRANVWRAVDIHGGRRPAPATPPTSGD